MSWNRREALRTLGVGSASTLLWALGCGPPPKPVVLTPQQASGEVRGWLRDAVARLATKYPVVHALAVSRRRTTGAIDLAGTGVARARRDGVVLTIRDRDGIWREQVTADLSEGGVLAAVRTLAGVVPATRIDMPVPPAPPSAPAKIGDLELRNRLAAIMRNDRAASSRIVYASALIDIDDVNVWSIAPGHDREQQLRRVRQRATRAAWNGTRPVVSDVERGWTGAIEDHQLDEQDVTRASIHALQLMTPGAFADGEYAVVLEPEITAMIVDAAVRGLLTASALRRPEVALRIVSGAAVAPAGLTLVDDPGTPGAYGGFAFDDEGAVATATTLLEGGRVAGRLTRGRRAGHVGTLDPVPSHLRLDAGTAATTELYTNGWLLEGKVDAVFDPSSDRIVLGVSRAREIKNGSLTGRVFADLELVGELAALLANVTGLGKETETVATRDDRTGEPHWSSITAPWVRTRGFVRARRRSA